MGDRKEQFIISTIIRKKIYVIMKLLFVSPSFNPFDGTGWGAVQRTNLLFEACSMLGHVDVVTFMDGVVSTKENCNVVYSHSDEGQRDKEGRVMKLLRMFLVWNPYSVFPKNNGRAKVVGEIVAKGSYDLIVCRYVPAAMECGLFDYADKLVIDVDDSPLDVERTASRIARTRRNRIYHRYRAALIGHVLNKIQHSCRFTFYALQQQAVYTNSAYLPNIPFYEYDMEVADFNRTMNRLLFVGNLSYGPNLVGVETFLMEILPLVRREVPDVEIHLVGGCNDKAFVERVSAIKGVKYMGFIKDIQDEYKAARVVVVPIYGGAGTNIKVLETMRMKRPCVTTVYGARGFVEDFVNNIEIAITDSNQDFATVVVKLLCDENANHTMAERAFEVVSRRFSRKYFNDVVLNSLSNSTI